MAHVWTPIRSRPPWASPGTASSPGRASDPRASRGAYLDSDYNAFWCSRPAPVTPAAFAAAAGASLLGMLDARYELGAIVIAREAINGPGFFDPSLGDPPGGRWPCPRRAARHARCCSPPSNGSGNSTGAGSVRRPGADDRRLSAERERRLPPEQHAVHSRPPGSTSSATPWSGCRRRWPGPRSRASSTGQQLHRRCHGRRRHGDRSPAAA